MSSEEMHQFIGQLVYSESVTYEDLRHMHAEHNISIFGLPFPTTDNFTPVKGRPPPYTEGEVTTTSGVVQQSSATQVVIPVLVPNSLGPKGAAMTCPSCNQEIVTRVEHKATTKTHLFALLICLLFWPCVCLPYCMDSCRNADHYCPNCSAYIGSYKH